ncbi:MAG: sigma-54-dependent Fis family transcriptional regulator, partial [Blastocatellia bacterium]|nr:sigma-54-dependent Fis family transcriptional regulator [Blastocatellia bacterium]
MSDSYRFRENFAMKALIVDDEADMRLILQTVMRARGYEVNVCVSAEDAWEMYQKEYFPLVILDWLLPGIDGLQLCQKMRTLPHGDLSVILMVTGKKRPEDLQQVLQAGADDYLAKPVDLQMMNVRLSIAEQQVKNLLKRKMAEEERQKTYEDMLSILNQLRIGTAMTDEEGRVTFLSQAAESLLGRQKEEAVGKPWKLLFKLQEEEDKKFQQMFDLPSKNGEKLPINIEKERGQKYWIEVEVREDPRSTKRKILHFYDVTEIADLRRLLDEKSQFESLVGKSDPMKVLYQKIQDVASVDATVLVEGETGTGKELVARAIHSVSHRKAKPFIAVNCAGLTESLLASQLFGHKKGAFTGAVQDQQGLFEAANGGTLFLDEIGDIPMLVQTHLLRVLQEKEIVRLGESKPRKIDVRVVAATHRNLAEEVEKGTFRQDLLYRIRVARINIPSLRERKEDIPLLVGSFLSQSRASIGKKVHEFSNDALRLLMAHNWPGNVRELKNTIERAIILSDTNLIDKANIIGGEDKPYTSELEKI